MDLITFIHCTVVPVYYFQLLLWHFTSWHLQCFILHQDSWVRAAQLLRVTPCLDVKGREGNAEKTDAKITARSKNRATAPHSAGIEDSGGSQQPCPGQQSTYTGAVPAWAPPHCLCMPVEPGQGWDARRFWLFCIFQILCCVSVELWTPCRMLVSSVDILIRQNDPSRPEIKDTLQPQTLKSINRSELGKGEQTGGI